MCLYVARVRDSLAVEESRAARFVRESFLLKIMRNDADTKALATGAHRFQ